MSEKNPSERETLDMESGVRLWVKYAILGFGIWVVVKFADRHAHFLPTDPIPRLFVVAPIVGLAVALITALTGGK